MLAPGDEVTLRSSGTVWTVGDLLGAGGQGSVFEAHSPDGRNTLALKWYRPDAATRAQATRLQRILSTTRPSPEFLWPLDLVSRPRGSGFGYLMPQRADGFESLSVVMRRPAAMPLRTTCRAAGTLADAFLRLHTSGLCYSDVSLNNIFVDSTTGSIEICDNDNVTVDGERTEVLGTPYYMAPEIVRGEAEPTTSTDRFSLSVILFQMLVRDHPLLGARETACEALDEQSLQRLLGEAPLFVFDPLDAANRPTEAVHDNAIVRWPALPHFVRDLFERAFTGGLTDPEHGRVAESEWRRAMRQLRGLVRTCPSCSTEQFWDPKRPDEVCAAPDCRAAMPAPLRMIGQSGRVTVLEPGMELERVDLTARADDEGSRGADVVRHPRTGEVAIRNRSALAWTNRAQGGDRRSIPPGAAVVARPTTIVEAFGETFSFQA